jgi:hypothetical protein
MSQLHPVPTTSLNFLKIHLNIILPSTSWSPQWPLSLRLAAVTSKMKIVGYVFRTTWVGWWLLLVYLCWHNRFIRCHMCHSTVTEQFGSCLVSGGAHFETRRRYRVSWLSFSRVFRTFSRNTPWYLKLGHDRLFYPSVRYILHQELTIWRDAARNAGSILK